MTSSKMTTRDKVLEIVIPWLCYIGLVLLALYSVGAL